MPGRPEEVAAWVKTMDEVGIETTVILSGATGAQFDQLVDLYLKPYPTRFQLFCGIESRDFDKPDYPQRAAAELERCYKKGARGAGELTDKGWGYGRDTTAPRDKRLHPDDPRLDPFWNKARGIENPGQHPHCRSPVRLDAAGRVPGTHARLPAFQPMGQGRAFLPGVD